MKFSFWILIILIILSLFISLTRFFYINYSLLLILFDLIFLVIFTLFESKFDKNLLIKKVGFVLILLIIIINGLVMYNILNPSNCNSYVWQDKISVPNNLYPITFENDSIYVSSESNKIPFKIKNTLDCEVLLNIKSESCLISFDSRTLSSNDIDEYWLLYNISKKENTQVCDLNFKLKGDCESKEINMDINFIYQKARPKTIKSKIMNWFRICRYKKLYYF